jgi:hypothetical protein
MTKPAAGKISKHLKECRISLKYASLHFPFVLSVARSGVYRSSERETLSTNLLIRYFPNQNRGELMTLPIIAYDHDPHPATGVYP